MDKQWAFDTAYKGIIAQGGFGYNNYSGRCEYRTESGCRCAIGQLIPDDLIGAYEHSLKGASGLFKDNSELRKRLNVKDADMDFLDTMQLIHDSAAVNQNGLKQFKNEMRVFGLSQGLNMEVLDNG